MSTARITPLVAAIALVCVASSAAASELDLPPGDVEMPDAISFVFVGEPASGLTVTEVQDAIVAAAEQWNEVPCSTVDVSALEPAESLDDVPEGAVPVFFVDLESVCFPVRSSGSQSIGFTVWCDSFPRPSILLNSETYRWRAQPVPFQSIDQPDDLPVVDLPGVIAHEMGHALLLPHIDDPIATMFASYRRDGSQATLSAADDLKLCELYPGGESECAADDDCREGACLTAGPYGACDSFRGKTGEFCSWETLQCADECFFSSPATGTGYCTEPCEATADCPDQMECRSTSNGSSLCQFEFGDVDGGCATGSGGPVPLGLLILGAVTWRRRRLR